MSLTPSLFGGLALATPTVKGRYRQHFCADRAFSAKSFDRKAKP